MMRRWAVLLLLLVFTWGSVPAGAMAASSWADVVSEITAGLDKAVALHAEGKTAEAKAAVDEVYFDVYEKQGMEATVRLNIFARRAAEEEYGFTQIKRLIGRGAPQAEVLAARDTLVALLRADAAQLGGAPEGPGADFLSSFLIIVREGLEAILVLAALIAYLVKSGNGGRVRSLYGSALAALTASVLTAWLLRAVFQVSGAGQEILEGVTMLAAVVVLFFVSYWLLSKAEADRWQQYIKSKVESSLTTGNTMALWWAAFLAVYREGAETVLFYQALLSGGVETGPVLLGLAAGAAVLLVVFILVRVGSVRLPLKPFFAVTGTLMYYLAFVFAGQGVRELQEGGLLGAAPVPGVPVIDWLGVYPTWQSLSLQALLLLLAAVAMVTVLRRSRKRPRGHSNQLTNLRGRESK
ncbi:MAG: FTR1 family iron permease [Clostridia bacterium]|nr:MAG: FTR1 family iron permease [Clostridia bacterium]